MLRSVLVLAFLLAACDGAGGADTVERTETTSCNPAFDATKLYDELPEDFDLVLVRRCDDAGACEDVTGDVVVNDDSIELPCKAGHTMEITWTEPAE